MEPVHISNKTRVIGAPKDWVEDLDGPCVGLDVFDHVDEHTGIPFMRTAWSPAPEELLAMVNGEPLWLDISGHVHPVIRLFVRTPT